MLKTVFARKDYGIPRQATVLANDISMTQSLTKTTIFGLNDLLKHELQQTSVAEEGEAAVSLEG